MMAGRRSTKKSHKKCETIIRYGPSPGYEYNIVYEYGKPNSLVECSGDPKPSQDSRVTSTASKPAIHINNHLHVSEAESFRRSHSWFYWVHLGQCLSDVRHGWRILS
jgi:hypothetical protein